MSVKMELGDSVSTATPCCRNFIEANSTRIGTRIHRTVVNKVLKEESHRAVLRRRSGIEGDWYLEFATKGEMLAFQLLDEIGNALEKKGISLDDLIESGREIRQEIYDEKYAGK